MTGGHPVSGQSPDRGDWDLTTPNGCRHCRVSEREHMNRWATDIGWHKWTAPTDEQRLERMRSRREERKAMVDPNALIDELEAYLADSDDRDVEEFRDRHPERVAALDACRAVLAQHTEDEHMGCAYCGDYQPVSWPCPTVRAITNALKETT